MSVGSIYMKLRQKYQHGLRTVWYRDHVRGRILRTRPVTKTNSDFCEIHVLTSKTDYINLMWALKSFYFYSQRDYSLCIHEDGTLEQEQITILRQHFPNARIILKKEADEIMRSALTSYPASAQFRMSNHLAPKLFDFKYFLKAERMLLLDSDILFFENPKELIDHVEDITYKKNIFNKDVMYGYTVPFEELQSRLDFTLIPYFNSGLGLIHKDSIRTEWIEQFLHIPDLVGHFWRIEQTLFALCSSRFGVELLPSNYDVRLDKGIAGLPARHYVGAIRHLMYSEGVRQLINQGFLTQLR